MIRSPRVANMRPKLPDNKGALAGVAYRVPFVAAILFLGYKMALACSRTVFLQEYLASSQPGLVVPVPTPASPTTSSFSSSSARGSGGIAAPGVREIRTDTWPVLYPTFPNESESLLQQVAENRTLACYQQPTFGAHVFGLPKPEHGHPIRLPTGKIHELLIVSYEESGRRRCAGGDFFETDLAGANWKARPPVLDHHDGSYGVQVMVDSHFAGPFVLKVVLLFSNFHALDAWNCTAWSRLQDILTVEIEFVTPDHGDEYLPALRACTEADYALKAWSGRWNRHTWNDACEIRDDGRFVCIHPDEECDERWCDGKVGLLESNGWAYSAHCKFHVFTTEEAWDCLDGRWLFFWGDSNNEDTVRNLLNFVLGFPLGEVNRMRRWFNGTYYRPGNGNHSLTITKIFNGHAEEAGNLAGLSSLESERYRELLASFWNETRAPDTMVMNSGLHDAHFYRTAGEFAAGVEHAIRFWNSQWRARPAVVYRTTVTGAGYAKGESSHARDGLPNPHKMEIYNRIFVEKLQKDGAVRGLKVVDAFDLTFPWHYDLNHTDGVHYGREPSKSPWPWRPAADAWRSTQIGHQYFVDLMLVHILLNAVCPLKP